MSDNSQTENAVRALRALARAGAAVTLRYEHLGPGPREHRALGPLASYVSGEVAGVESVPAGDGGPGDWLVTVRNTIEQSVELSRVETIQVAGGLREARRRAEGR